MIRGKACRLGGGLRRWLELEIINANHYRLRIILWDDMVYVDWMRNEVVIFCEPISDKKHYDKRIEMSNGI